jgi:hypothetical protein
MVLYVNDEDDGALSLMIDGRTAAAAGGGGGRIDDAAAFVSSIAAPAVALLSLVRFNVAM